MSFKALFETQKILNDRIVEEHRLQDENLYEKRLLALLVELGELANETRCFKYWSLKPPASKQVILEEYVDGLHFVLSIGLDHGLHNCESKTAASSDSVTGQFLSIYRLSGQLQAAKDINLFHELFSEYLGLGELLGFTVEEIKDAYYKKNEINHQRQNEGY